MADVKTQTLGFPRIGKDRQIKRALESYWRGRMDQEALNRIFWEVQEENWRVQRDAGIDRIGVGDETLYDHVLDWVVRLGLIPERFRDRQGLDRYFTMARGATGVSALDLTKWFDTNYHYLVPEVDGGSALDADFTDFLETIGRAQRAVGDRVVPIILGPVTLLRVARLDGDLDHVLESLLPRYRQLLTALKSGGVGEVQIHEPALVLGDATQLKEQFQSTYTELAAVELPINLVTYFDDLGSAYPWAVQLPVPILSLDLTRGHNLDLIRAHGWPTDKTLGAGVVDGRSVWRIRPEELEPVMEMLRTLPSVRLGPSCSLQFVPYQAARETQLADPLWNVLAFAEEKLQEVRRLAQALGTEDRAGALQDAAVAWEAFSAFAPANQELKARVQSIQEEDFRRAPSYQDRRPQQIQLPPFPTTTIGSYPQTSPVRRLRARYQRGEINLEEYQTGVDAWIAYTIGVQDGLGLDVLVHGEFERSDMVEYFAHKLNGFAFTEFGWVQSYGHRYVRPPIIYADVTRPHPMTVREFRVAQSFTHKPVKGMLTGPVTILGWSYARTDVPQAEVAFQIALALRDEITDLEAAGARVVQVDEPALREGLPLKPKQWGEYLTWAVNAFRLATGGARPETQVHTHMCYSEFSDILTAIDRLGADVILIENARSGDQTLRELATHGYAREIGPGVYDIHSPVVPTAEQIQAKLRTFLKHFGPEQIWVNPDCGLKTRAWEEVNPALEQMVKAASAVRAEVLSRSPKVGLPAA